MVNVEKLFFWAINNLRIVVSNYKVDVKKTADTNTNIVWLPPLYLKVCWSGNEFQHGDIACYWQGMEVYKTWDINGDEWEWVGNTNKNVWPKELCLNESLHWWNGVALYQKKIYPHFKY